MKRVKLAAIRCIATHRVANGVYITVSLGYEHWGTQYGPLLGTQNTSTCTMAAASLDADDVAVGAASAAEVVTAQAVCLDADDGAVGAA